MDRKDKIIALILAAGFSSRMGDFKPLLQLNGITVLESAITCFRRAGITDIRVVVGHRADELIPLLHTLGVIPVINEQYASGMFSSIKAGLRSLADEVDGFFLLPGDMPLVKSQTVQKLLETYYQTGSSIIYPAFGGRRGHPPLIGRKCFSGILSWDPTGNLREALRQFEKEAVDLELIDHTILLDMDTPADFQRAVQFLTRHHIPTLEECGAIFCKYQVSDRVVKHGRAVAKIGRKLAEALNQSGFCALDIELITIGGLLHDIAKGADNHAQKGAAILEELGFPEVAKVIVGHMDYELNCQAEAVDEGMIVYLADKLIVNKTIVPIAKRFADIATKYAGNLEASNNIEKRMKQALSIQAKVEVYLGVKDIFSILSGEEVSGCK